MSEKQEFVSVGRRKTSVARVKLTKGSGKYTVNGKDMADFCYTDAMSLIATRPLAATGLEKELNADIKVNGGGAIGQSGAISHGLARAIEKYNPELRAVLKKAGLLTRDSRSKERKKPGQPGARRRFQFSKR